MKFLITHSLAGSFIGVGGASIKELMDMSGARVSVSSHSDLYPGTTDRVLLMTGSPSAVIFAACLVWDNFAIQVIRPLFSSLYKHIHSLTKYYDH